MLLSDLPLHHALHEFFIADAIVCVEGIRHVSSRVCQVYEFDQVLDFVSEAQVVGKWFRYFLSPDPLKVFLGEVFGHVSIAI